jgi:dTDP-4-amino-4,6-dideoxygalactose transaminase
VISKFRKWSRYFYQVPWCVPAWGWSEFGATLFCTLTGKVSKGQYPNLFADEIKKYLGMKYALPVNHGRVGIEIALRAMQLSENDEVIIPSYICHTVLDAVLRARVHPVFADVGPELHLTLETVEKAITPKTKCVIVPHLFGSIAPIDKIEEMLKGTEIALIDDAAQSFGAKCSGRLVGTFGDCGIVSCGPGKALVGAAGGLLITKNGDLYSRASAIQLGRENGTVVLRRVLSFWIWRRFRKQTLPFKIVIDRIFGMKDEAPYWACKMSNLDAAIALKQFRALEKNYARRLHNACVLLQSFEDMKIFCMQDLSRSPRLLKLVLLLPKEGPTTERMIHLLSKVGIESQRGYYPLHQRLKTALPLPFTEDLWKRVICIPADIEYKSNGKFS